MATRHEFRCDACGGWAQAIYNGEHYLPPKGWMQLYDPNLAEVIDKHLCVNCTPKVKQRKRK